MAATYGEYLAVEYKKAVALFEEAKKNAVYEIGNMDAVRAEEYGAGYAAHIDKISVCAAKVRMLAQMATAYACFNPDDVPALED